MRGSAARAVVATLFCCGVAAFGGCSSRGGGSSSSSGSSSGTAVKPATPAGGGLVAAPVAARATPAGVPTNAMLVSYGKFGHTTVVQAVPAGQTGTAYVYDVTAGALAGKYTGYGSAGGGTYSGSDIDATHDLKMYFLPAGTKPKFAK